MPAWPSSPATTPGTGLAGTAEAALTEAGVEVVYNKVYDEAQTFDAEVDEMVAADPDAILLIAFDEASRILTTMVEKGIGPTRSRSTAPTASSVTPWARPSTALAA